MGPLVKWARWAALEQMGLGASQGIQDLRVIGALTAFQGCLVRRAKGVILDMWGNLVPPEKMVRGAQRDLQGPLARLGSRAPED